MYWGTVPKEQKMSNCPNIYCMDFYVNIGMFIITNYDCSNLQQFVDVDEDKKKKVSRQLYTPCLHVSLQLKITYFSVIWSLANS